ncbi:hypothetical protein ACSS6W_003492 [Trichoderma asperelloides]|uniref:Uncharacterized protein n=1 Tax=Trichoderma asperellum TaxID=101201 RepID=A0A6V8QIZ5_TRIAP|nr:hypothetical protein TASIC1_0001059900 [Trichoderma asperellum]
MRSAIVFTAFIATALADWSATSAAWPTKTVAPAPQDDCANSCQYDYDECCGAPGANLSTCSSEYAECLGYNPYDGQQHDYEEKQKTTECSTKPTATATATWATHFAPPPTPTPPPYPKVDCKHVKECTDEDDKCRTKPEANQAECSAEYAKRLGFNPFTTEGANLLKQCEEEGHKPGRNETGPPHPKPPPVIVSGASSVNALGFVSFLAAAAAAALL